MIEAGADAVEIGLPFSDPMLDGPVIQQASAAAIARGATTDARSWPSCARPGRPARRPADRDDLRQPRRITGASRATAARSPPRGSAARSSPTCPVGEADELPRRRRPGRPRRHADGHAGHARRSRCGPSPGRSRGFLYVMSVMATTGRRPNLTTSAGWALAARALARQQPAAGADRLRHRHPGPGRRRRPARRRRDRGLRPDAAGPGRRDPGEIGAAVGDLRGAPLDRAAA